MGYPSIPLNDESQKILTIVMSFRAYECLTLPMRVMPAFSLDADGVILSPSIIPQYQALYGPSPRR
jgi:hypothetical protein